MKEISIQFLDNIKFAADCAIKEPDSIYAQEFFMLLDETFGKREDYKKPVQAAAVSWLIGRVMELGQRAEVAEHSLKDANICVEAAKQEIADLEAKLAELAKQEESRWNTHDGIARPIGLDKDDLVYLRMKRQEIKIPYPAGMVNWKHDGGEFDVIAWASAYSSPRPAPAADLAGLVPSEFPAIRLQKAKLWIDRVLMDKPGMKEAQTISAILRKINEAK